ncbi:hypothetical protein CHS0354_027717, partial [Potamilus streckersoni]
MYICIKQTKNILVDIPAENTSSVDRKQTLARNDIIQAPVETVLQALSLKPSSCPL